MKQLSSRHGSAITQWIKKHKKLTVSGLVFLVMIGSIIGYAACSVTVWQGASDSITHTNSALRSQSEQLLQTKAQPSIQDVRAFESEVNTAIASTCEKITPLKWQTNVSATAKDIEARCQKTYSDIAAISTSAHAVVVRVENENSVTKILTDTDKKLQAIKINDFKTTIKIWHTTREKITKINVDESLRNVKKQAVDVIHGIEVALSKLDKANQEKNRAAFDSATAEVEKAYSKLSSIQNTSVDSFTELVDTLIKSTQKLEG